MDDIRRALFEDWDPIGVNSNQKLRDEYDGCIATVYRLLAEKAPASSIVDCLENLERKLGIQAKSEDHLRPIVDKLLALNIGLD